MGIAVSVVIRREPECPTGSMVRAALEALEALEALSALFARSGAGAVGVGAGRRVGRATDGGIGALARWDAFRIRESLAEWGRPGGRMGSSSSSVAASVLMAKALAQEQRTLSIARTGPGSLHPWQGR